MTGRSTKRSRGDTGRPTPRNQRADAQALEEAKRLEEREKLAMKDAQEKVEFKPYSEHTEKLATAVEKATADRHVVSVTAMIEDMQAESQSLVLATQSSAAGSSRDQPSAPTCLLHSLNARVFLALLSIGAVVIWKFV